MGESTPYTSPHDPTPFDPNAQTTSNSTTLPSDLTVPTLSMYWQTAPDFTVLDKLPAPPGGPPSSPGTHQAFWVHLSSLRAAEDGLLSASTTIVDAYTALRTLFEGEKDWVFGQQAIVSEDFSGGSGDSSYWTTITQPDPIADIAKKFANGDPSTSSPGMNAAQEYVLQVIGNVMGTLGEFIVAIDNAGAAYASSDHSSLFPPRV